MTAVKGSPDVLDFFLKMSQLTNSHLKGEGKGSKYVTAPYKYGI